ncbi:MAG: hypothetical protein ACK5V3_16155 [Bdellovibrionales bacterium]
MKSLNLLFVLTVVCAFAFPIANANALEPKFTENPVEIKAAYQITEKNEGQTYDDPTPAVLFAIPIFKVFVDTKGFIQNIEILRTPSNPEAQFTVQMGLEAIKKSEPFENLNLENQGVVFNQTFLFRDDLKFKLRALDTK